MAEQSGIQSLERAFSLVELLSQHPKGMYLLEVAEAAGLHKSTAHRMLGALISMGYARKLPESEGKYQLTLKLYEVAARVVNGNDMLDVARPVLERLCDKTGEAVHLVLKDGCDIVYVYKAENPASAYQMGSRVGMRRPLYCTAAGKSILSTLDAEELVQLWAQSEILSYTPQTIHSLEALQEDLDRTRRRGYAVDEEENEPGVRCVAAPIYDYTGGCKAALSVSAPVFRMPPKRREELGELLRETAAHLSAEMGYRN